MLRIEQHPVLLVEVKKFGFINNGEEQVRRYSSLLKPNPKFTILTDGVQWRVYYVGLNRLSIALDENTSQDCSHTAVALRSLAPARLRELEKSRAFDYVILTEQALEGLSEDARKSMMPHFLRTVCNLLLHIETPMQSQLSENIVTPLNTPIVSDKPQQTSAPMQPHSVNSSIKKYAPATPPDLEFTKCRGRVGQENVSNWTKLVHAAIRAACQAGHTLKELQANMGLNMRQGIHTTNGFNHVTGTTISVQGVEANRAWPAAWKVAQLTRTEIEVDFEWRDKAEVLPQYRGKQGSLYWSPGSK